MITINIREKIKELDFKISEIKIYQISEIQLGMKVDNQNPIMEVVHIPTDIIIRCDEYKSQHKNVMKGLEMLREKIKEKS